MKSPEQLYYCEDEPGTKYRILKPGERTGEHALCWHKSATIKGGLIPAKIPACADMGIHEDDGNHYFTVAHVLVPHEAASRLLDLWFGKYHTTCEDGEEAAAWQQLKEVLYPTTELE